MSCQPVSGTQCATEDLLSFGHSHRSAWPDPFLHILFLWSLLQATFGLPFSKISDLNLFTTLTCMVTNALGSVNASTSVITVDKLSFTTSYPLTLTVFKSSFTTMPCEATGLPLKYSWFKKGSDGSFTLLPQNQIAPNNSLILSPADTQSTAVYRCQVDSYVPGDPGHVLQPPIQFDRTVVVVGKVMPCALSVFSLANESHSFFYGTI